MNIIKPIQILQLNKIIITPIQYAIQVNGYAVAMKGKKGSKKSQLVEKKKLPVETDVNKLINYCCGSNFYVEGEDVKLKPDSEYPDWLWSLHTGPPVPLEELDPNTKEYWRRKRNEGIKQKLKLMKYRRF